MDGGDTLVVGGGWWEPSWPIANRQSRMPSQSQTGGRYRLTRLVASNGKVDCSTVPRHGDQIDPRLSGRGWTAMLSALQVSSRWGSAVASAESAARAVSAAMQSARLSARYRRW